MHCTLDVGRVTSLSSAYATHLRHHSNTPREMKFKRPRMKHSHFTVGGGRRQSTGSGTWGKKEKLLIRTHTCQPSGLFGFRTRFTFLLAGQAEVFRIFLSLATVSVSQCEPLFQSQDQRCHPFFSRVCGCFSSGTARNRTVWSWRTGKMFGLRHKDLYWM